MCAMYGLRAGLDWHVLIGFFVSLLFFGLMRLIWYVNDLASQRS